LVESGGQPAAFSPKGARGIWQFMPDTARRYGLVVSADRDERSEVVKSTRAAARYLRDLHQQFGDWQLAFAAYNAGEQAVEQAVARTGQHSFSTIQRALPKETRNYVPAVLNAMAVLGGNPEAALRAVNSSSPPNARLLYASAESSE
jgi:membrane-bound lytic murein transglycosylase D